jgi:SAM-dependent methyltransferase
VKALAWTGEVFNNHEKFARLALNEIADVPDPRIIELGAGHGGLSRKLLEHHPTAQVTVSDIDETSVADIARGDLGRHPRAEVRVVDARNIDAGDGAFDLAVFALSFHHLAPRAAAQVIGEATRVADKLLIVDLGRLPSPLHVIQLGALLPFVPFVPFLHDGFISSMRAYSASALHALAEYADPAIDVQTRGGLLAPQVVIASRTTATPEASARRKSAGSGDPSA